MEHLELGGSPFELGQQHGRSIDGLIGGMVAARAQARGLEGTDILRAARHMEAVLMTRCPELLEEMRGIANGANLPYEEILLLNIAYEARGDLLDRPVLCTAIGLPHTSEGPLVAKTDDVGVDEREFEVFYRARPDRGHGFVHYALAGTVWDQGGINDAGLALAMTGLQPAGGRNPNGIPSLLFLRLVLQRCSGVQEALNFAEANPLRGHGCTMTMADPSAGSVTVVENYPTRRAVRRYDTEPSVHTNHPQFAESLDLRADDVWADRYGMPGLIPNSVARAANGARLAKQISPSIEGLKQLLGNHAASGAICQHGQAELHTSFAVILVPRRRAMFAAEGYGCGDYVEYSV